VVSRVRVNLFIEALLGALVVRPHRVEDALFSKLVSRMIVVRVLFGHQKQQDDVPLLWRTPELKDLEIGEYVGIDRAQLEARLISYEDFGWALVVGYSFNDLFNIVRPPLLRFATDFLRTHQKHFEDVLPHHHLNRGLLGQLKDESSRRLCTLLYSFQVDREPYLAQALCHLFKDLPLDHSAVGRPSAND